MTCDKRGKSWRENVIVIITSSNSFHLNGHTRANNELNLTGFVNHDKGRYVDPCNILAFYLFYTSKMDTRISQPKTQKNPYHKVPDASRQLMSCCHMILLLECTRLSRCSRPCHTQGPFPWDSPSFGCTYRKMCHPFDHCTLHSYDNYRAYRNLEIRMNRTQCKYEKSRGY